MIIKYKKRRRLFIKIYALVVAILLVFNLWSIAVEGIEYLNILTSILLTLLCIGLLYYQIARYDHQKITARYGFLNLYFKDITEVKYFAGDLVIKTEKHSFGINTQYADETSLHKFIKTLKEQTEFELNWSKL